MKKIALCAVWVVVSVCLLCGQVQAQVLVGTKPTISIPRAADGYENIALSSLELENASCGWSTIQANKSIDGNDITLHDTIYSSGVGTHSESTIVVKLNGSVTRFYAKLGIDDEVVADATDEQAICDYLVYLLDEAGEKKVVGEGTISGLDDYTTVFDIDYLEGWKYLVLQITNGSDGTNSYDHVDWANAYFTYLEQNSTLPAIVSEDVLNSTLVGARTVFSQPGVRFMHKLGTTEEGATLSVSGLPDGLEWNAERQLVDGRVEDEGEYTYYVSVTTAAGDVTTDEISLCVSSELELPQPFMGWLSWNAVESEVSEEIVLQVAELFEEKGLKDYGWNTIMMDDWWHADSRASDGKPQPNAERFPNGLTSLAATIHDKGMRFGLYTDAAEYTCAGAFGSYGYEEIDAETYAEWGVDIVKCDYCNAPDDQATAQARYTALAEAFKASGRQITLYICEWGVREPWLWGAEAGGACWRVSYDVRDCWQGSGSGVGVVQSINTMKNLSMYQGVNRWNDADMLCTGLHGTGKSSNSLCLTGPGMTQDEYRTQFALWCMWSSPMALSFDPRNELSDDDLAIITNAEMIALNQDLMGQQADLIAEEDSFVVFTKDLENGDVAVAVVNLAQDERTHVVDFSDVPALSSEAVYSCRDVQLQEAVDDVSGSIETSVRSHATQVYRLSLKETTAVETAAAEPGFSIRGKDGRVVVSCPETKGELKRVVVSDASGRQIAQASGAEGEMELLIEGSGVYLVSITCNGRTISQKVRL